MSGTFSNLIREVFSYWFVRALLYPKMTPRTYNLFTVFVVFKRRKKRKSEVRTRRRQRRSILENGWGFVHHRRLEKEGEKKESLPSESSSNGPVANGTSRRKTRNPHLASRFMRLHSHPSFAPIAFSFLSLFLTPTKNSRFAHQKSHHHHRQNERRRERRDAKRETPPHLS